jgi:hypothetical protein
LILSVGAALGWLPVGEGRILDREALFATAMLLSVKNPDGLTALAFTPRGT